MSEKPPQPPEGKLISEAMKRRGMSARAAAQAAGISDTRWRHIVAGYQPVQDLFVPVSGPAETVARMARAVGVTSDELRRVGRGDAADQLDKLQPETSGALPVGNGVDPLDLSELSPEDRDYVRGLVERLRRQRGE